MYSRFGRFMLRGSLLTPNFCSFYLSGCLWHPSNVTVLKRLWLWDAPKIWCMAENLSFGASLRHRVATNLENMENLENSGNLKNCQNLGENSGKFEFLQKKTWKTQGKHTICGRIGDENVFQQIILSRITQGKV